MLGRPISCHCGICMKCKNRIAQQKRRNKIIASRVVIRKSSFGDFAFEEILADYQKYLSGRRNDTRRNNS